MCGYFHLIVYCFTTSKSASHAWSVCIDDIIIIVLDSNSISTAQETLDRFAELTKLIELN